jgi:hypothetical protein
MYNCYCNHGRKYSHNSLKKKEIIYIIKKYLHSIVEIASLNSSHIFGQHNILISMKKMKLFSNSDAMSKIDQKIYPW